LLLAIFGVLLWALSDVVLLVFAAVLFAVLLRGVVLGLARLLHVPLGVSFVIVGILILAILFGFARFFGPRFISEGQQLIKEIFSYAVQMQHRYANSFWMHILKESMSGKSSFGIEEMTPKLLTITFGTVGGTLLLVVTALYLAISPRLYMNGAVLLVPTAHRTRARQILRLTGYTLRYWMLGQLVDMLVVGVLTTLGLFLLGVPLALALGVLAGVFTFVPYFGAIMAGLPAVIVASTMGMTTILWVILLYLGCHLVEGYIVAPLISHRTVRLPPAVTMLAMAILGELYSLPGVLIATPLTAVTILWVKELYVRDFLETPLDNPGD
ncbi:MAG TPA: AI-2E family transporter, partial [Acidiphilium sp.]